MKLKGCLSLAFLVSGGEAFIPRDYGRRSVTRVSAVADSSTSMDNLVKKLLESSSAESPGSNIKAVASGSGGNENVLGSFLQDASRTVQESLSQVLQQEQITKVLQQEEKAFTKILQQEQNTLTKLLQDEQNPLSQVLQRLKPLSNEVLLVVQELTTRLQQDYPAVYDVVSSYPFLVAFSALISFGIFNSILLPSLSPSPPLSSPYPDGKYDPIAARAYFDRRLESVALRTLEVSTKSLVFGLKILKDYLNGQMEENEEKRGLELAELLTFLGPSFIKIGQSLSIRTDLLSPGYVRGLQSLQDQVPPFDSATAKRFLEKEWGGPLSNYIESISEEPIAAASLGQVYKATLKDGRDVAIKVQRPEILEQIALDMYLIREIAPIFKRTFNLNTDTVGTVDAWGVGFVDELDYLDEAANAKNFMEGIQDTPLKEVVFAPTVVDELTTGKVLVTEWIDGERLDKSSSEDVTVLCSIAMNTYLTMLLELGVLHCDPHPGNLLRSQDGRLCILDWGMVTRIGPDLQLTLIEHMAHLTSSDYAEVPRDLLLLGFIPEEKAEFIEDSGVVEVLADVYGAWTSGGGAASINVNQVIAQLQDLQSTRGNLFRIPPYFAYIAKSFSVLEGIGLSNDAKYSIVNECLPYVSKRLLTDNEAMGPALSTFIFGPDKDNKETRIVDYKRVEQLVTGFGNYTTSASGALLGKEDLSRTQLLQEAADQVLDLVVTEDESPAQEIILEQLAKIISAGSRSIWALAREQSGLLPSGRSLLGTLVDPLGLWRTSPLVQMNELDEKTVETTRKLISLMQTQAAANDNPAFDLGSLSREEATELSAILIRKVWERRVAIYKTGNRLATKLLQMTADRLEKGERDFTINRLPSESKVEPPLETSTTKLEPLAAAETIDEEPSARLQSARRLLRQLEDDEKDNTSNSNNSGSETVIVDDAVPVKFD